MKNLVKALLIGSLLGVVLPVGLGLLFPQGLLSVDIAEISLVPGQLIHMPWVRHEIAPGLYCGTLVREDLYPIFLANFLIYVAAVYAVIIDRARRRRSEAKMTF